MSDPATPITPNKEAAASAPPTNAPVKPAPLKDDYVFVRILPKGDGLVFTGDVDKSTGQPTKHAKGDIIAVPRYVGEGLEQRGFGEIQPE